VSFIALVPGQMVAPGLLVTIGECVSRTIGLSVRVLEPILEPPEAYDPQRRQYSSTAILRLLIELCPQEAARLVAITEQDIFIPMLSFIFGQAQLDGRVALVSLARLRQEFYGLPPDEEVFRERACKETLHELGHTFGLTHCDDLGCTMSLATSIQQVDTKSATFCPACTILLAERLDCFGRSTARPSEEESP